MANLVVQERLDDAMDGDDGADSPRPLTVSSNLFANHRRRVHRVARPVRAAPTTATAAPPVSTGTSDSELRDWIKDNATLMSNASLLISLAAVALSLLPSAGLLDPYIKALIFGAALILLIELHHQWPDDLQIHVLSRNPRPKSHSWRMIAFAFFMQVATLVFAVWATLSNPIILMPLTALGVVLAFRQWYFRHFGGLAAKAVGILALVAVLILTEVFMLAAWSFVTGNVVNIELYLDDRSEFELDLNPPGVAPDNSHAGSD